MCASAIVNSSSQSLLSDCIKYQKLLYSPLKKKGFVPERGSEIYVRNIPEEDTEYDVLKFFQNAGEVFQVRLMMQEDGHRNRGFAYVTYFNAASAKKAVTVLGNKFYKENKFLSIEISLNNCRLFIGGIPTYKKKDQVWQELHNKGVKNILDVIMYRSYSNRAENRGFVFVEFKTHEEAAHFRAKFVNSLRLWDKPVVVDWSIPVPQVDIDVMEKVKVIYLRNLDVYMTREDLLLLILKFIEKPYIEKIYKFKNYAFIHLASRPVAEQLMENLEDHYKETLVEVSWAKPPNKFTTPEYRNKRVDAMTSHLPVRYSRSSSSLSDSSRYMGKHQYSSSSTLSSCYETSSSYLTADEGWESSLSLPQLSYEEAGTRASAGGSTEASGYLSSPSSMEYNSLCNNMNVWANKTASSSSVNVFENWQSGPGFLNICNEGTRTQVFPDRGHGEGIGYLPYSAPSPDYTWFNNSPVWTYNNPNNQSSSGNVTPPSFGTPFPSNVNLQTNWRFPDLYDEAAGMRAVASTCSRSDTYLSSGDDCNVLDDMDMLSMNWEGLNLLDLLD